jgi:hypothetical protein
MGKKPSAPPIHPDLTVKLPAELPAELPQQNQDEGMTFRLKRISDIRDYLENEAETRGRLRRRYKSSYNAAYYVNAGASILAIGASTAAATSLATGIGAIASLPLGIVAITSGVLGVIGSKISKIVLKKVEKHERIKLIAMSKLSSVNGLVSTALRDGAVSDEEFNIILLEMESYRDHKTQIGKKIRNELSTEKEQEIREEAQKKGILQGQELALKNLQRIAAAQTNPGLM